jgi:hypothetical protein
MVRVLRYPRLFYSVTVLTIICALLRDACVSASLDSFSRILLVATIALLSVCLILMSCRFFVDAQGIGVGFLLRIRRTDWDDIAALGLVCCNSRRTYFYGMYRGATDFLNMLHHAPACGPWGFVVPVSKRLLCAISTHCPFKLDLSSVPRCRKEGRLRPQWHHAALYTLMLLPAVLVSFTTSALMLIDIAQNNRLFTTIWMSLGALALITAGVLMLKKLLNTALTCPAFNEHGVRAGLYLPWENVQFGYVHRYRKMSGMFLLSQPLDMVNKRSAPPVSCLSMPDTTTLLLAYLTYCPHANKNMDF